MGTCFSNTGNIDEKPHTDFSPDFYVLKETNYLQVCTAPSSVTMGISTSTEVSSKSADGGVGFDSKLLSVAEARDTEHRFSNSRKSPDLGAGRVDESSPQSVAELANVRIHKLFEHYKDPDVDLILADGIEKFCADLGVQPDEFVVLVLAWKFHAETMCQFTRAEFADGCRALRADSIRSLRARFPELIEEAEVSERFRDLYRWTYRFGLETGQRTLPVAMAVSLWRLVFSRRPPAVLNRWLEFVERRRDVHGILRDTWDMFLTFVEVIGDDLSHYDDMEAWPSLMDDFVEYENDRRNHNVQLRRCTKASDE